MRQAAANEKKRLPSLKNQNDSEISQDQAYYEYISIPPGQSFLWRKDDYPWIQCLWNYHPEVEIHLIRHSSGLAYIGDYIGNFDGGHLVLIGSNLPHNWITPLAQDIKIPARDVIVQFNPEMIRQTATFFPEFSQIPALLERAALGMEFTGETARTGAALLESMEKLHGLPRLNRLFELMSLMASTEEYRILSSRSFVTHFRPGTSEEMKMLEKALDYMQANFLANARLATVAALTGMTESAFSRFFRKHTGNTFSDHIISLRLWTARKLLADSDLPVTDVCYDAGFNNISNFNRLFLRHVGMTPLKYRIASRTKSLKVD